MFITSPSSNQLVNKRSRSWPSVGGKLSARRLVSQLMCRRLPLLVIWTLVMIVILYKALNQANLENSRETTTMSEFAPTVIGGRKSEDSIARRDISGSQPLKLTGESHQLSPTQVVPDASKAINHPDSASSSVITKQPNHSPVISTTKKSEIDEYTRRSKVFILIIQDENLRPTSFDQPSRRSLSDIGNAKSDSFAYQSFRFKVPAHIRLLIGILESHKIQFSIDSTRTGLPTALLTDQDSDSERKQYSVIVIDDFIKYTKLSRWARDQLDRHCRMNQIGVIAFLGSGVDSRPARSYSKKNNRGIRGLNSKVLQVASGIEESLANQFPITFKPTIFTKKKSTCYQNSTLSCVTMDYQVNEKNPILRILKRRKDFILDGPIAPSLNQEPWMTMSSNHITYEPLVWARSRQLSAATGSSGSTSTNPNLNYAKSSVIQSQQQQQRKVIVNPELTSTQERNHNLSASESNEQGQMKQNNDLVERYRANKLTVTVAAEEYDLQDPISAYAATKDYNKAQLRRRRRILSPNLQQTSPANGGSDDGVNYHDTFSGATNISSSSSSGDELNDELQVLSMFDHGLYDGIKRVIFGGINNHWLHRVLILDAIEHLSSGMILDPLERYIQIDIDDIFVGERGKRMKENDVDALLETQQAFANRIDGGFKFNLGFSGKYFKHGYEDENLGDERLVEKAKHFHWFCHTWSHSKAHLFNETSQIEEELRKNLRFAQEHRLPIIGGQSAVTRSDRNDSTPTVDTVRPAATYAVAPHHSGVYPIHEQLYDAWNRVLNVQVTSTEEYPHLRPASARRAFVHKTIKVLPRQTCGLYTHTILRDRYPGGIERLDSMIKGGELFETILHNPVNIYMTHMSNYANDRLASYTFTALLDFVQANTNLQLKYVPSNGDNGSPADQLGPSVLADLYFRLFPNEKQPLWTNPCSDKRHLAIWTSEKQRQYCSRVPKLLIVGPQKTGTTALHSFLKVNPVFQTSHLSAEDFEEVQFFNDKHYHLGVDWYFDKFVSESSAPETEQQRNNSAPYESSGEDNAEDTLIFDKSATYFDDPKVPERASVLLPNAYIVILLVNPADRAYSWYQHMKAHNDQTANLMSFEQLITSAATSVSSSTAAKALLSRCLHPGYYAQHISRWLNYYPSRKMIIIDGQWFKQNPASVMNRLQLLLRLNQPLDYRQLLVYSERKGFYCLRGSGDSHKLKCLGKSKGRKYPPMSETARAYLNRHFWPHNRQLARILSDIGQPLPTWLDEALGPAHSVIY